MRSRFTLRAMFLAISVLAGFLAFLLPVAKVNRDSCARILSGMTIEQASAVVGAPPGWYDGVGGVTSEAPREAKSDGPSWIGMQGEICLEFDEDRQITKSSFYPVTVIGWSPAAYFWERFTRIQYMRLSVNMRVVVFAGLTTLSTVVVGMCFIAATAKNGAASHGVVGISLGVIFALAIFSNDFFPDGWNLDPVVTLLAMSSALVTGAFLGIVVGLVRGWLSKRSPQKTDGNLITNPAALA